LQSMSLRDNITLGQPDDDQKLQNVLYQAVLEQDIATLENGPDTLIGPKGVKLSGGQVQRAAAARMFFTEAELMVFDDLSSALDVDTEHRFWERIFKQKKFTYLAVSHSRTALRLADNIIVLKNGAIDAHGKLNDLMESCEEMQFLWKGVIHQ
jgi:ATP-binding cassette, subfamily B, bacterial